MLFDQAMDMHLLTDGLSADDLLKKQIYKAIATGVDAGNYTSGTITWGTHSPTEAGLIAMIQELQSRGYGVTLAATTITVTW